MRYLSNVHCPVQPGVDPWLELAIYPGQVLVDPGVDPWVALPRTVHTEACDPHHAPGALIYIGKCYCQKNLANEALIFQMSDPDLSEGSDFLNTWISTEI